MKLITFILFAFLFLGCGVDSELLASGKIHACDIAALRVQVAENPGDTALQAELTSKLGFLEAVINSADEGSRAELQEAINAATAAGCD